MAAKKKTLPSSEVLNELLSYDPLTGLLIWKERSFSFCSDKLGVSTHRLSSLNARLKDKPAFTCTNGMGYKCGSVLGQTFLAHRVIWKMCHGSDPFEVDHINHIRDDNRLVNLAEATRQSNNRNTSISSANKSGFVGVCWDIGHNKWRATITVNRKTIYLGIFKDKSEAIKARTKANDAIGFHKNHGDKKLIDYTLGSTHE